MRGGSLPPAMLCAALGFALSFAPRRAAVVGAGAMAAGAVVVRAIGLPAAWQDAVFLGCWASVILTAAAIHLPRGVGPRLAIGLAINAGLWAGAVTSVSGSWTDLAVALPCVLLCVPGAWMVGRGWGVAVKVAGSWLIAISILAASLSTVTTPGYAPDHME